MAIVSQTKTMIPKIIHQTAKTAEIPPKWEAFRQRIIELHPDWEYRLWTDSENLKFVAKEFPEYLQLFNDFPKGIMRADVIRYMLMYRLGGFYMDLDYEMIRPFDLCEHRVVLPYSRRLAEGDSVDRLGNAVFASEPGNPFWKMLLDDLLASPPVGENVDVESATGPNFVTRICLNLDATERQKLGIHMPDRILFHPEAPTTEKARKAILNNGRSYGIHHCHGTWRTYGFLKRSIRAVRNIFR